MTLNLYIYEQRKEARAEGKAEEQLELLESLLKKKGFTNNNVKSLLNQVISQGKTDELLDMILDAKSPTTLEKYLLSSFTVSS